MATFERIDAVVDDLKLLSLDKRESTGDGCYCDMDICEDHEVRRQVLAGCDKMMDCSEELDDFIGNVLDETIVNYYTLSGIRSVVARCSLTNQLTRNYTFLSNNLSLIGDLNHATPCLEQSTTARR